MFSVCQIFSVLKIIFCVSQCDNTFPDGTVCGPGDFVELEDPDSCYHYYLCDQGCVTHETCPAGQKFDSLYSFCNSAQDVDCRGRPCDDPAHCPSISSTTPGPDCLPPDQMVDCSQLGPGIFPDLNNCRLVSLLRLVKSPIESISNLQVLLALFQQSLPAGPRPLSQ